MTTETLASTALRDRADYGGSADAVQYHYDVGRAFYQLFLDATMTYSCALWDDADGPAASLQRAQLRKIDHHLDRSRAAHGRSLLDIGCGWGGLVQRAAVLPGIERIVALTLSRDQADCVRDRRLPNVDVRLESWADHAPAAPYDSIVSVGAFEHFAAPEQSIDEKVAVYRDFFTRCRQWLTPQGRMSLQTIAYGSMHRDEASAFINNEIFPAADLPTLDEIARAASGVLEITELHNHRLHYARTLEHWASNLRRRRGQAVDLVGEETTARYLRYLTQSAVGFYMGKIGLLRLSLRPVSPRWAESRRT
jgi:cyclopropane-fatty-acyl-phospholipid synthase